MISATLFDSVLAVYSRTGTNLTCVSKNDNISLLSLVRSSILRWIAVPGARYFLHLGGKDNTHSGGSLSVCFDVWSLLHWFHASRRRYCSAFST